MASFGELPRTLLTGSTKWVEAACLDDVDDDFDTLYWGSGDGGVDFEVALRQYHMMMLYPDDDVETLYWDSTEEEPAPEEPALEEPAPEEPAPDPDLDFRSRYHAFGLYTADKFLLSDKNGPRSTQGISASIGTWQLADTLEALRAMSAVNRLYI
eukprot:SAG31_NODE_737_length_12474_cov_14.694303_9_plen_155_part_00